MPYSSGVIDRVKLDCFFNSPVFGDVQSSFNHCRSHRKTKVLPLRIVARLRPTFIEIVSWLWKTGAEGIGGTPTESPLTGFIPRCVYVSAEVNPNQR